LHTTANLRLLQTYAVRWNILNVFRMFVVGTGAVHLFGAFRQLDR
jgi:hypothetical protein